MGDSSPEPLDELDEVTHRRVVRWASVREPTANGAHALRRTGTVPAMYPRPHRSPTGRVRDRGIIKAERRETCSRDAGRQGYVRFDATVTHKMKRFLVESDLSPSRGEGGLFRKKWNCFKFDIKAVKPERANNNFLSVSD